MTGNLVDLASWTRAAQFQFFRTFERPHYATTVRMDVSTLMAKRKSLELSPFRHAIWAIGTGLHAVPELLMRFDGDVVTQYERTQLSSTISLENGDFRYTYFDFDADRARFDAHVVEKIAEVRTGIPLNPNTGAVDVAYLSCLPWLDYTSLDNALPGPDDCIPRISWGKIVPKGDGFDMAMTIQVHHALVDGLQVAQFFEAMQDALASIA